MDKKIIYIGGGVAALGVVGGLAWYFTRPKPTLAVAAPPPPRDMTQTAPPRQQQQPAPSQYQQGQPPPPQLGTQQQQPAQGPAKLPQMFWQDKNNKTRAANTVAELRHGMWKEYGGNLVAARTAMVFFDPADPRVPQGHAGAWRPASFLVFPLADDNGATITSDSQLDNLLKISSLNDPGAKTSGIYSSRWVITSGLASQGVAGSAGSNELHNHSGLGRRQSVFMHRPLRAMALAQSARRGV
jgi:hypothetical protein